MHVAHCSHMLSFYNGGHGRAVTIERRCKQPRTQALSTTRLAGGKTLVQAVHVSPRFWEITEFLHKGGGLSFILPI